MASQPPVLNEPSAAFVAQFVTDIQSRIDSDNKTNQGAYELAFKNWLQNQETLPPGVPIPPEPDPNRYPLYTLDQAKLAVAFLAYSDALYAHMLGHVGSEPVLDLSAVMTKSAPARLVPPSVPKPDANLISISAQPIYPGTPFYRAVSGDSGYVPEGFKVTQGGHTYSKEYSVMIGQYWVQLS